MIFSAFNAIELALEVNLAAIDKAIHRFDLSNSSLRYSFYKRTDGLYAHMISTIFNLNAYHKNPKKNFGDPY